MRRLALAIALFACADARAIEFELWNQPLRVGIVESFYASYHGDLGPGLVSETDVNGTPTTSPRFVDLQSRLNVDLGWRRFRAFTRFDTAAYPDRPAGACGPDATTPVSLRSRFCQSPFYVEKWGLEYNGRAIEAVLGDFYVSFGRGMVLSIRKIDELGIDTTLRGGKLVYHEDRVAATLVLGVTNMQNVDEATGRTVRDYAPEATFLRPVPAPRDFIGGSRVEYRFFDRVNVGLHEVGGVQAIDATASARHDSFFLYGGSVDAPKLLRWLGVYFEGAGQMQTLSDAQRHGYALYGALNGYFGPVTLQLEVKDYVHYQPWKASIPGGYVEFAPVQYLSPPTAERVLTELQAPIFDVRGPRLRADWRVNDRLLVYASYAYFEDRSVPTSPLAFHDPYAGAELRWSRGQSHFFPSGGYRLEWDEALHAEHQHVGHIEWDGTQALPRGLSIETQGFVLVRNEPLLMVPPWTEGNAYLALKWTPYLVATLGYEWTTLQSTAATHHFFNGALQWNFTTASSIRVFVGGTRGGLKCISGVCRVFPPFTGARLELVLRI
ncbi:MAG TPA: hypothetical protein VF945_08680 [Polyangia bacterium]